MSDYREISGGITLHGLGFIQCKLPNNSRLHVWHPELPRRACFDYSAIHNHRFSFMSRILIGTQINHLWRVESHENGTHDRISHDGPRSPKGGRESFVDGRVRLIDNGMVRYDPGDSYVMPMLQYHSTPNDGIVVTVMRKITEGQIHAHSVIERPHSFDQDFDRFQLSENELLDYVKDAFKYGASL